MKKAGRFILLVLISLIVLAGCTGQNESIENEDDYPSKPVKIVVAYSPGGGSDRGVRLLQPYLEKELGQPVVVENMPGAGTEVATTVLTREPADGYTIIASSQPDLNWTLVFQNPKYEAEDIDIAVVDVIDPRIVLTKKDSPWNTFMDFVQEAKERPGELSVSLVQNTGQHVLALYLKDALDIDFNIVPYDGGGPAAAAMLGGHVDLTIGDAFSRYDIRDQAKCIGVASDEPNELWPEGLPLEEQLKEYEIKIPILNRCGIFMVQSEFKEQYPERYNKLVQAFVDASQNEEYQANVKKQGLDAIQVWKKGKELQPEFDEMMSFLKNEIAPLMNVSTGK